MLLPLDPSAPRTHYDIAYACFLLIGLTGLLGEMSFYQDGIDLLGIDLGFLLSSLAWVPLVVGVVFSVELWRHAPLPILAALTVLLVFPGFFVDFVMALAPRQQEFWFKFIDAVLWAYEITATVIALWWFFILRRRADGAMAKTKPETLYHDAACGAFLFLGLVALWIAYVFPWEGPQEYRAAAVATGLIGGPGISMAVAIILFAWFAFKSKDTLLIVLWLLTLFLLPFGVFAGGPWLVMLYGALTVIFSTWWFAFARRKKKRQA